MFFVVASAFVQPRVVAVNDDVVVGLLLFGLELLFRPFIQKLSAAKWYRISQE